MSDALRLNPKMHQKLFDTAGELTDLKNNPRRLSRGAYASILRTICCNFTDSLDHGLPDAIYAIRQGANDYELQRVAQEIFDHAASFANYLKFEEDILIECGASKAMARDTLNHIQALRDEMVKAHSASFTQGIFNPEQLIDVIKKSTSQACDAANQVEEGLSEQQSRRFAEKRALLTTGKMLLIGSAVALTGGAASLVAGAVAATSITMIGGFITASSITGNFLIHRANALKDPLDEKVGLKNRRK